MKALFLIFCRMVTATVQYMYVE